MKEELPDTLARKSGSKVVDYLRQRAGGAWLHSLHVRWPWLRNALAGLLLLGGLLFVGRALQGQLADLTLAATAIQVWVHPVITVLATLSVLVTASLHAVVVAGMVSAPIDLSRVRYAYALSQVARYLPGKVFGVILEAQMLAPAISLRQVVVATLVQTLLIYAWAGMISAIILGALILDTLQLAVLGIPALGFLWLAQRNRWSQRLGTALLPNSDDPETPTSSTAHSRRRAWQGTLLLLVQWVPFLAIWVFLATADHGISVALWLAASYLLASMFGSLLVLVPSGLVVREAAFVWLGSMYDLPATELMAWAVAVRLALTLADAMAVPLLWTALKLRDRQ